MIEGSLLRANATGSGAERWMNCPASVSMSYNLEEERKKYATEGTAAHELAASAIASGKEIEGIEDPAVRVYVECVRDVAGPGPLVVEERLSLLGSSGGLDCYAIRDRAAFLFDFKYGVGVKLQALDNEQLAFYACALREKYPQLKVIHCTLVQPRVDDIFEDIPSISSWTLPYQTLGAWRRKFEMALQEVERAQTIKAGSWCRFCKARGGCPVHIAYAEATEAEVDNLPAIPAPGEGYPANIVPRVARALIMLKRVKPLADKAEEFLLSLALKGIEIPGFELAKKRSYRKWHTMYDADRLAEELKIRGIDDPWEKSLIPITRAEKLVAIDDLVEKPEGAPTLKPLRNNPIAIESD